jgi:hypothetical protein
MWAHPLGMRWRRLGALTLVASIRPKKELS